MVKTLELAIAKIADLPDADQEQIGHKLLAHVEKLRELRSDIDEAVHSLDSGKGKPLDFDEFLRRKNEGHGRS
jgi:hypothetical protein